MRAGARQSTPYCHLGTQSSGRSVICGIASYNVRGRETREKHTEAYQCLHLDLLQAPACANGLASGVCYLSGKEGRSRKWWLIVMFITEGSETIHSTQQIAAEEKYKGTKGGNAWIKYGHRYNVWMLTLIQSLIISLLTSRLLETSATMLVLDYITNNLKLTSLNLPTFQVPGRRPDKHAR